MNEDQPEKPDTCSTSNNNRSILDSLPPSDFDLPSLPDGLVDFSAGLGDALLLGTGNLLRDQLGINGSVDTTSTSYRVGAYTSYAAGIYRASYAMAARYYSVAASSGAEASAIRASMRMAGAPSRNLAKYKTDDALRAAAGRTNPGINAYGAGIAAAGAYGLTAGCR